MNQRSAVFLDRDGVLNPNVLNPKNGEYESPHCPEDFVLFPEVPAALRILTAAGYHLFLVSNQPSYAKGKTSLENIHAIHDKFQAALTAENIQFDAFYYCYSHPESKVAGFGVCPCRKPSPYFLFKARDEHGIHLASSWMLGDRNTDIQCGQAAGVRTILIQNAHSIAAGKSANGEPDYIYANIALAAQFIGKQL